MNTEVGVRELRSQIASLVRRAGAGEAFVITVGGHPTALLGPLGREPSEVSLDVLIARGMLIRARRPGQIPLEDLESEETAARVELLLRGVR